MIIKKNENEKKRINENIKIHLEFEGKKRLNIEQII